MALTCKFNPHLSPLAHDGLLLSLLHCCHPPLQPGPLFTIPVMAASLAASPLPFFSSRTHSAMLSSNPHCLPWRQGEPRCLSPTLKHLACISQPSVPTLMDSAHLPASRCCTGVAQVEAHLAGICSSLHKDASSSTRLAGSIILSAEQGSLACALRVGLCLASLSQFFAGCLFLPLNLHQRAISCRCCPITS